MAAPKVDRDRAKRDRFIARPVMVLVAVVVLLLVIAAGVGFYAYLNKEVTAPDLVGMTQQEALSYLRTHDFIEGEVGKRVSSQPEGTVVAQTPRAGARVAENTPINIYVSAGEDVTLVPEVLGLSEQLASGILYTAGIPFDIDYAVSTEASGTVIAVNPPEGTVIEPTDVVRITIALDASSPLSLVPFDMDGMNVVLDPDMSLANASRDIPLEVANKTQGLMEASGATVVLTRSALTKQVDFTVESRQNTIKDAKPDVVITITTTKEGTVGLQAMYVNAAESKNLTTSRTLAETLVRQLKRYDYPASAVTTAEDPLGIKNSRVYDIYSLANLSARADMARLNAEDFVDNASHALYSAVALTYDLSLR